MRSTVLGLIVVLALCVLPVCAQEKQSEQIPPAADSKPTATEGEQALPKIEVTPTAMDFGEIWIGAPAKQVFTIRNAGKAPLTITSKSSCGCTVATKPKSPLAPGESTEFSVSYNTKRQGKANKKVTLTTNDPANKKIVIPVTGTVKALFDTSPSTAITFRDLSTDSRETKIVKLKNQHDKHHKLKIKEGQKFQQLEVSLKEVKPGQEYELAVTTVPPLTKSNNRTNIVIETDSDISPTISIPVRANVQAKVYVVPPTMYVIGDDSSPKKQTLRLHHRAEIAMKVLDVKFKDKSIPFEIKPNKLRPGSTYSQQHISITLPTEDEISGTNDKLVIVTDNKDYSELEVPIRKRPKPTIRRSDPNKKPEAKRRFLDNNDAKKKHEQKPEQKLN